MHTCMVIAYLSSAHNAIPDWCKSKKKLSDFSVLSRWPGALTLGVLSRCGFGNMGRSRHKSLDQSAALSQCRHSTPSLTAACTTCFFCVVLFVLCLIRNILSKNHVCIVWSLLSPWYCIEKKCGEKNYEVCWPSPCKKKSNVIIRKDFKMLPFLVQKRNLWREPQQWGMCYCVGPDNDLLEIY